jgi:hypothetical protein
MFLSQGVLVALLGQPVGYLWAIGFAPGWVLVGELMVLLGAVVVCLGALMFERPDFRFALGAGAFLSIFLSCWVALGAGFIVGTGLLWAGAWLSFLWSPKRIQGAEPIKRPGIAG